MSKHETAKRFVFTCEHVDPKWRFSMESIRVTRQTADRDGPESFYATHGGFGCGRDYADPESAIRGLIESAGCFNIHVHIIKPKPARALLDIENRAITAIAKQGLHAMGGAIPADLLADNMSYFDFQDLARALEIKESDSAALMCSLADLGFVYDTLENPNRDSGPAPSLWVLTDSGIAQAGEILRADNIAYIIESEAKKELTAKAVADSMAADIAAAENTRAKFTADAKSEIAAAAELDDSDPVYIPSISVSGYRDNRAESDKSAGGIVCPAVAVFVNSGIWDSASVSIDSKTARKIAGELFRAADAIDNGADYSGSDYAGIVDSDA